MDEIDIWLSESDSEELRDIMNPKSFTIELTYQGQPGGFHVRNLPGQLQRTAVSSFQGGLRKKPAFTVSCNAKAIIHGEMGPQSVKRATLLVYDLKFNSYKGARIKQADILFEFKARNAQADGPSVRQVAPLGLHKMRETLQGESSKKALELSAGPGIPAIDAGLKLSGEASVEKVTKHYTVVTGENVQDGWGYFSKARFYLSENKSQFSGIPSELRVCILLERDGDDDFVCVPYINVTPDFKTRLSTLFSKRKPDDPVIFSMAELPFNELDGKINIDRRNLGKVNLDELWDCTEYYKYERSVK